MYLQRCYEELASAIILQAVNDYRTSWKKGRMGMAERIQLQRFFHSPLFASITDIEPDFLIRKLEEEHR